MATTFNPAPFDRYADERHVAARADRDKLYVGLVGTFPASDPVSALQPSNTRETNVPLARQD
ncbi:hypothetical protein EON80_13270 [bacterium]|nr:MAG: hypothetical protein EON80_13270 [bacterium]